MGKAEFLDEMSSVRIELDELLSGASDAAMRAPAVAGQWSCADIVAHFAGYTRGGVDLLAAARGAEPEAPPYHAPPGLSDDDINAIVVEYWRIHTIPELLQEERAAFQALTAEAINVPDSAFVALGQFAFAQGRSLDSFLAGQSYAHYREHFPALHRGLHGTARGRAV